MPKLSSVRLTKRVIDAAAPGEFLSDSSLRGFGLRVSAAGSKAFVISYRIKGSSQRRMVIGSYPTLTADQARDMARDRLLEVAKGGDPSGQRKALRIAPTMSDLFDYYVDEYAVSRKLKPRTMVMIRQVWKYSGLYLTKKRIEDVLVEDIRNVHGQTEREHGRYQANRLLSVISKMFSLAIENNWILSNPCLAIKKFPEDQRWRNLTEEEVRSIFKALSNYQFQNPANAIRLLLYTGARLSEVTTAEWAHFDLLSGLWVKPSSHTKTQRQHRLELAGPALDLLRSMRSADGQSRYLFPGKAKIAPDGTIVERPRADLKRCWDYVVKESKAVDVRLHDLRRTTASFMLSDGASLATVGKTLGHTQASTTARYAHLSQDVQRAALKGVGDRMHALIMQEPLGAPLIDPG